MNTFELNPETATWSIDHLLNKAAEGGIEVKDTAGKVIAFILSPENQEALTYLEANLDLNQHPEVIQNALKRSGGVTTAELLANAKKAAGGSSEL